jgi:hypothetical protein
MKLVSRRELLADLVVVFALPLMGCGEEPLKPAPEGSGAATSQPKSQREAYEQSEARAKEARVAAKAKKK